MSDVDGVVENGTAEDEFVDANDGEEQDTNLVKKDVKVEITDEDGNVAVNGVAADDDRTEDQVPDITGTDNVDPMTTSMDGIEEIPVNEEAQQEPKEEEGGEEIPVEQFEDAPEEPAAAEEEPQAQEEEQPVEETPAEEPAAEEPAEEVAAEEVPVEEETPAEEPAEEAQAEEPAAEEEQAAEEVPVEEEAAPVEEEAPQEEEAPAEEQPAEEGEQAFELQAPPTPKRPRTPNELDNVEHEATPALSGQGSAVASQKGSAPATPRTPSAVADEAPGTPKSSFRGSQVGSQAASQAASQAGSQPGTPKPTSNAGSVPPTPRSGRASIVSEGPKASEPGSPRVATPRSSAPGTPKGSGVGSAVATPRTGATGTPQSKKAFDFDNVEETPATPRTPKRTTFQDDNLSVARSPRTPRTPRTPKSPKTPSVAASEEAPQEETPAEETPAEEPQADEPAAESEEPQAEETVEEPKEEGEQQEAPTGGDDEAPSSPPPARAQSPSPPPRHRAQSPSPPPRRGRDAGSDYASYDQDSHRETVPARMPTTQSFSSWNPPERSTYQPISPWVNTANKYANEHTVGVAAHPTSTYTSIFDDLVSTGPFSHSLYSTNRLLERSRSRTRERRQAFRSQRSASQYVRYTSQLPAPLRTREFSTPRSSSVSRVPGRYGSFTSFLDYSGAKQYELSRQGSRGSLYDSTQALSRWGSRGNIDFFLGAGRMSRVDSYVNNLNSRYEYQFPASHDIYHSASRGQISYGPLNQYQSYSNYDSSYSNLSDYARMRRAARDVTPVQWKSMYETRVGELQRSLSRERFERDRLKNKYSQVSYQLEQAVKQMDLLRTNSYSSVRSGSQPRTSVYSHFYPYY